MFVGGVDKLNIDLLFGGLTRLPSEGEELYGNSFSMQLGGGTAGTLVNLKRLGVPVKLASYFSHDLFSQFAQNELKQHEIPTVNLAKGETMAANLSVAMLTPNDRTFVSYGETPDYLHDAEERFYRAMQGARVVVMEHGRYYAAYRALKKEGATLVFDGGYREDMSFITHKTELELADFYLPNRKEGLTITGASTVTEALLRLADYVKTPIIKLDKDGVVFLENGAETLVPPRVLFEKVDATGAGDAFLAGFLYGIYHGYPIQTALAAGNLTGGKCVSGIGCLSAYFTEENLLSYLA